MKAIVVLPTYNEKENIKIIIPKIEKAFEKIKNHRMHLLVVDDKSPDGTADEVKKFQKEHKNIHMLSGDKQGLGVAYLRGFKHAIDNLDADIMIMMDADLSHPPELLEKFMESIDEGYDFVIGSRYIKGGDTPDWSLNRRMISKGGNLFARFVAGLYKVHDCTSGYRAIKVNMFKKIKTSELYTKGYAFQITLLYELLAAGAKINEIPLVFYDRKHGTTKLQKRDFIEFFINSFRLRIKSMITFIIYVMIGTICSLLNLGLLFAMVEFFHLDKRILAPAISLETSIIASFVLNDSITFRFVKKQSLFSRVTKFHIATISGFFLNLLIYNLVLQYAELSRLIGRFDYLAAQCIAIMIVLFWNFFINSRWTWKEAHHSR